MTAALSQALPKVAIARSAFLLGSVAPDLALWLLSIGSMAYFRFIAGWSMTDTMRFPITPLFDELYFHNPVWLISHNLLHAPIILLVGLGITAYYAQGTLFSTTPDLKPQPRSPVPSPPKRGKMSSRHWPSFAKICRL
ncbi:MAG: hypothetical protein MUF49_07995 [Oculatellaceae cyanobacterium Prado106]|nr:hypothetical protein [Oculatellaceae cyanobacterium Prado106]